MRIDGKIKITDFDIARNAAHTITQTGTTLGMPSYMAPEQILNSKVDGKADQFSLAVLAYEMLSGRKPFTAETTHALMYQIVNVEPARLDGVNSSLPPACASAVLRALAKDPGQRYPNGSAFIGSLGAALGSAESPPDVYGHRRLTASPIAMGSAEATAQRLTNSSRLAWYAGIISSIALAAR